MAQQLESRVVQQLLDVALVAGEEIIHTEDFVALADELIAEVAAQKSGAARDQAAFDGIVFLSIVILMPA